MSARAISRQGSYAWQPLVADETILWLKYWWGPGSANSLAFMTEPERWVIVSPPKDAPADTLEYIAGRGTVDALISPNGYHYLGQVRWRERFPDAASLAPTGALHRLRRKSPSVPFRALEPLLGALAPARILIPKGMKTPDTLISLPSGRGRLWWLGDQFSNNGKSDQVWPLRLLSRLLAGGPGFHCNPRPELVYVHDRATWGASMLELLGKDSIEQVICAHGDPVVHDAERRTLDSLKSVLQRQ